MVLSGHALFWTVLEKVLRHPSAISYYVYGIFLLKIISEKMKYLLCRHAQFSGQARRYEWNISHSCLSICLRKVSRMLKGTRSSAGSIHHLQWESKLTSIRVWHCVSCIHALCKIKTMKIFMILKPTTLLQAQKHWWLKMPIILQEEAMLWYDSLKPQAKSSKGSALAVSLEGRSTVLWTIHRSTLDFYCSCTQSLYERGQRMEALWLASFQHV